MEMAHSIAYFTPVYRTASKMRSTPDSEWVESPLSRNRHALLGAQRRNLSYDEEPAYLVHYQVLQLRRQLIQLRSGEIQDQKPLQLRQLLWLVQGDQQPVLVRFQTGPNQQAW